MFFLQILGTSMVPPAVKIAAATATELPGDWGIKEGKINIIITNRTEISPTPSEY